MHTISRQFNFTRTVCLLLLLLMVVAGLLVCHPPSADETTEPTDVAALIDEVVDLLQDNYLDVGVAERCAERVREKEAAGAYARARTPDELARAITADLQAVSHDLHMRVKAVPRLSTPVEADGGAEQETVEAHPLLEKLDVYHFEKRGNFGVMDVKWLSGNVGYLDLRAFLDLARVRPKIESAMVLLSDMDAVIIDLRSLVRGGYPETVGFIAGYFFDEPTLLQRIIFPRTGDVDETWTQQRSSGPDLSRVPLYILTSEKVFSAGEAFTYGMQAQGRATVVGTTTKGGAHLTRSFRIEPGFDIHVPIGRSVNPVTGGDWEGVGVVPDVATEADDALDVALDLAQAAADEQRMTRESEDRTLALDVEAQLFEAVGEYGQGMSEQAAERLCNALELGLTGGVLTEDVINDVGYYFLEQGLVDAAVDAFRFNVQRFPNSPNAHDSLGEALAANGRLAEAEASYRRALELDPHLSSARAALDRLEAER